MSLRVFSVYGVTTKFQIAIPSPVSSVLCVFWRQVYHTLVRCWISPFSAKEIFAAWWTPNLLRDCCTANACLTDYDYSKSSYSLVLPRYVRSCSRLGPGVRRRESSVKWHGMPHSAAQVLYPWPRMATHCWANMTYILNDIQCRSTMISTKSLKMVPPLSSVYVCSMQRPELIVGLTIRPNLQRGINKQNLYTPYS